MQPIEFKEMRPEPLGAGDNPNTGPLPFQFAQDPRTKGAGVVSVVSCWKPSEEELAQINEDGVVYIAIMASAKKPTQPPIYVLGHNPFAHHGFTVYTPPPTSDEQISGLGNFIIEQFPEEPGKVDYETPIQCAMRILKEQAAEIHIMKMRENARVPNNMME